MQCLLFVALQAESHLRTKLGSPAYKLPAQQEETKRLTVTFTQPTVLVRKETLAFILYFMIAYDIKFLSKKDITHNFNRTLAQSTYLKRDDRESNDTLTRPGSRSNATYGQPAASPPRPVARGVERKLAST